MENQNIAKTAAKEMVTRINAVEGFDPEQFAVDYEDSTTGEKIKRLPVMAQMAWFRLKYPQGKIAVRVANGNDCFVATAKVYADCHDPDNCFLAEATASRGFLAEKPSISPREWAQTAAVGMALRNAGFGLQFRIAGDSFPSVAPNEFAGAGFPVMQPGMAGNAPGFGNPAAPVRSMEPVQGQTAPVDDTWQIPGQMNITEMLPPQFLPGASGQAGMVQTMQPSAGTVMDGRMQQPSGQAVGEMPQNVQLMPVQPETKELTYEEKIQKAMQMPCPIKKYEGKTLGDLVVSDQRALNWIAGKFEAGSEIGDAARLICEYAMGQASA